MQHQQGIAGAKGLIQAMQGSGTLHPDTVKTKSGTKYANLVMNVPSDRPQIKTQLIQALDNGDQKTAASLFLNMWKEKWASKGAQAQKDINQPKNAKVKEAIAKYCQKYGVPYEFAVTVAYIESGFNPASGNNRYKGVYALSQEEFNKYVPGGNILNAEDNVNAGVQCLKNNIKAFTKYLGPVLASLKIGDWAKNLA
jgi:CMP-2-keto-3-deoxyoctulosonic acid synthetase